MPTTPNFALPYPAATDPADVPADIQRLADKLDSMPLSSSELAYAQITTSVSVAAAATAVVTAPSVVYPAAPVLVEFCTGFALPGAGGQLFITLFRDGVAVGDVAAMLIAAGAAGSGVPVYVATRVTQTAAAHIYAISARTNSGTGTISAGAGGAGVYQPAWMRVSRA